ncbi:hypothetical protein HPP92_004403 [Vanilla planifolia]|uniref:Uncharacterized protein n=1 Tax=Vanilla planifolia TaxID=51239 RepID=A0A835SA21_VANPL|nr:hypothetical protein HPP92_004403 [Vanilla planifolia]
MNAEFCREAAVDAWWMGGDVLGQLLCGCVGVGGWLWIGRMGERAQLRPPSQNFWALHQVLPMPTQTLRVGEGNQEDKNGLNMVCCVKYIYFSYASCLLRRVFFFILFFCFAIEIIVTYWLICSSI